MQLRERLKFRGPDALSDADLLALLLGTGTSSRSAPDIAAGLLEQYGGLARLCT